MSIAPDRPTLTLRLSAYALHFKIYIDYAVIFNLYYAFNFLPPTAHFKFYIHIFLSLTYTLHRGA